MNPADNIKRQIKNLRTKASAELDEKLHRRFQQALDKEKTTSAKQEPIKWSTIMHSRITKLAAAAVIIIAAIAGVTLISQSVPVAYAIEQTIQAHHSVRYLHIKKYIEDCNEPGEFWVECNETGRVKNVRLYFPTSEDGPKVVVCEGKAQVWFKRKNSFITVRDEKVSAEMLKLVQECDPRLAVERLYEQEKQNNIKLDINKPSDKTQSIMVTVDFTSSDRREILFVDQATKLVTILETYEQTEQGYELISTQEYYDYNIPIDEKIFTFEGELPEDVVKIDQTTQEVGLAQGDMSDEEVATEVARQFFEALIAEDYAKAGQLLEGTPADFMKKTFGPMKFLRIISVGPVEPHPDSDTRGVVVPVTVEFEKDGQVIEYTLDELGIRQVYNQPGRWTIFGGI